MGTLDSGLKCSLKSCLISTLGRPDRSRLIWTISRSPDIQQIIPKLCKGSLCRCNVSLFVDLEPCHKCIPSRFLGGGS
jgi:hypothetical protein